MQIVTIRTKLKAFDCKFVPFEWDSKDSNASSNNSKGIRNIRMQILSIPKEFKCKFEPLENRFEEFEYNFELQRDLKHSNANCNHSNQTESIWMQICVPFEWHSKHLMQIPSFQKEFEAFDCKFKAFEKIRSIRMQIWTIRKGFEAFQCNFKPFKMDLKHSNANSNHSKWIQSIRMQIRTIQKHFKTFKCTF